ncbi:YpbB family protein [Rossellomorea sp. H39__3]
MYSVYHIIKGKKSSQSIQDAHLFGLQALFLSLPKLKRDYFDRCIAELQEEGSITLSDDNRARLTRSGEEGVASYFQEKPYPAHMDGLKHGDQAILLWKRLSLLVQVLSNARMNETSYFPVQRDRKVQDWLKGFIRKQGKTEVLSAKLFEELYTLLSQTTSGEIQGSLCSGLRDTGTTEPRKGNQPTDSVWTVRSTGSDS